ncbi:hypothetical protein BHE74_00054309, partial [Ensete ventricosum]
NYEAQPSDRRKRTTALVPPVPIRRSTAVTAVAAVPTAASVTATTTAAVPTAAAAAAAAKASTASAAKATSAASTVPTTSAAEPTFAPAVLGLVYRDVPAVKGLAVHPLDGVPHRLLVAEGDEPEAPRPPRLSVVDDLHRKTQRKRDLRLDDVAVAAESPLKGGVVGSPGKAAYEATELDVGSRHGKDRNGTLNRKERRKRGRQHQPTSGGARATPRHPQKCIYRTNGGGCGGNLTALWVILPFRLPYRFCGAVAVTIRASPPCVLGPRIRVP